MPRLHLHRNLPARLRVASRLARRLLTALSLPALLAVLALWVRAQWVQDEILHRVVDEDLWTFRWEWTVAVTTRGSLYVERAARRIELAPGPAADAFRAAPRAGSAWERSTRDATPLAAVPPGGGFLGFRAALDPPTAQAFGPADSLAHLFGWRAARGRVWRLAVPWWFLALCSALLPALSLRRRLRAGRRDPGTCARCGYDLRATPARCPECGTVPEGAGG